jgi:hypothetical protein
VLDRFALAALGERLLRVRERLFEHHDDEVLGDVVFARVGPLP